jgi:hypothetical protein
MASRVLGIIQQLSNLAEEEKDEKISQSFYLSKPLVERLKNLLPPNVSTSSAVGALIEDFVKEAEALDSRQERSQIRSSNKPEDEK